MTDPLSRLRGLCLKLPEVAEGTTVHLPSFKVRTKTFVIYADGDPPSAWIKARREDQRELIASDPERFFAPPYLGPSGWVAAHLDDGCDWDELGELAVDAFRLVAPKRLIRQLD